MRAILFLFVATLTVGCEEADVDPASLTDAERAEMRLQLGGVPCGDNVCAFREECCNASCGICVPQGMQCTQQSCN